MDPLRFAIATAPLGVYFLLMGMINLRRRPFVTTGARDTATLAIGISGLVIVGPMELFFPEAASRFLGYLVWVLLIAFYGLCASLVVLLMRPRIVVYNSTAERMRSLLGEITTEMDSKSRWLDDGLLMPTLNVKLNIEGNRLMNNVQLVAIGSKQNLEGWRDLELKLKQVLKSKRMSVNVVGFAFIAMAVGLAVSSTAWMVVKRQEVAQAVVEMLRL